jgi:hypothetical protein
MKLRDALEHLLRAPVESCSDGDSLLVAVHHHGLFAATELASRDHRPLVLSADIVWLTITQGIACHIHRNAEALRHQFVDHEGREQIVVRRDDFLPGSTDNPWPEVFPVFSLEIGKRIGAQHDLFIDPFTTTGFVEKSASEIALMDAMEPYFEYVLVSLGSFPKRFRPCGIPQIVLEGTPEDWEKIGDKLPRMEKLGLGFWTRHLGPVIDQFVRASKGDVDREFWSDIGRFKGEGGSASIKGWLALLLPYVYQVRIETDPEIPMLARHGERRLIENPALHSKRGSRAGLSFRDLPSGISRVPFLWEYAGTSLAYEFHAGLVGITQDPAALTLRPRIGWAVRPANSAFPPGMLPSPWHG